ncbi:hypothetical protein [Leucobacter sp. 1207-22]|uniref:hypothetical protein n=1 Tax=Leucobacter sp. 1207-22 TaxID=2604456 RepID=UPI00406383C7
MSIGMTTNRLQRLRTFARIERMTMLENRMREGWDPAEAVIDVPEEDDLVVRELVTETLEDRGQLAEFALARVAGRGDGAEAAEHKANADRVEFELLQQIADEVPELILAVWRVADRVGIRYNGPDSETAVS